MHVFRPPHFYGAHKALPVVLYPAAGPITLDAQPGAVVLAGSAASLEVGYRLDAQPGAVAIVGTAATLTVDIVLDAQPGAVVIVGTAATLTVDIVLDAQPGVVVLTGTAATLEVSYLLDAQPGAVIIAGTAATLVYSAEDVAQSVLELTNWAYINDRRYPATSSAAAGTVAAAFRWDASGFPVVTFSDESIGATSWLWNFADLGSSVEKNPQFDFFVIGSSNTGTFTVTLVINADPTLSAIETITVSGSDVDLGSLMVGQINAMTVSDVDALTVG